jgi:hypothetical protein
MEFREQTGPDTFRNSCRRKFRERGSSVFHETPSSQLRELNLPTAAKMEVHIDPMARPVVARHAGIPCGAAWSAAKTAYTDGTALINPHLLHRGRAEGFSVNY